MNSILIFLFCTTLILPELIIGTNWKAYYKPAKRTLGFEEEEVPPETTTTPPPKIPCDKLDCSKKGYNCKAYQLCGDDGIYEIIQCPKKGTSNLWWNPKLNEDTGGDCDQWDTLDKTLQDTYKNDKTCPGPKK